MAKISVIMPAYNVENYICEAVDSVLGQTRLPDEIIIIDDGSTDRTADKLKIYGGNPRVSIFHTENQGLGSARNYGLARASGDYVYFFDSDDVLNKDFVDEMSMIIEDEDEPDIIFFSGKAFVDEGFLTDYCPSYKRKIEGSYWVREFPIRKMQDSRCFYASACLYISKKMFWTKSRLKFKNIIHEDNELIFQLVTSADKVFITNKILFYRRLRKGSIMTSGDPRNSVDAYRVIIESLLDFYRDFNSDNKFDKVAFRRRFRWFILKYVFQSKDNSLEISLMFLLKTAFKARDLAVLLIYTLHCFPVFGPYLRRRANLI